jgi:hypothetical protein
VSIVITKERLSICVYITCRTPVLEKLPNQQCVNVEIPANLFSFKLQIYLKEIRQFECNFYIRYSL